jgi:hypothetical protein
MGRERTDLPALDPRRCGNCSHHLIAHLLRRGRCVMPSCLCEGVPVRP